VQNNHQLFATSIPTRNSHEKPENIGVSAAYPETGEPGFPFFRKLSEFSDSRAGRRKSLSGNPATAVSGRCRGYAKGAIEKGNILMNLM
jgi:hypothetical protein